MTNVTEEFELPEAPATSIGSFDVDNDGYEDLLIGTPNLETNRVLEPGRTNFRDITITSLGSFLDSPVRIESNDYDANGYADLLQKPHQVVFVGFTRPVPWDDGFMGHAGNGSLLEGTRITAVPRDSD